MESDEVVETVGMEVQGKEHGESFGLESVTKANNGRTASKTINHGAVAKRGAGVSRPRDVQAGAWRPKRGGRRPMHVTSGPMGG